MDKMHPRRLLRRLRSLRSLGSSALMLGLLCGGIGCVSAPTQGPLPVTQQMLRDAIDILPPVESGTLRIALAFAEDTDLDLGVTGPRLESVRFARPRGARGATFSADRGCGDPAPRVEIVEWKNVCPGRFEISIEHASDCVLPQSEEDTAERRWQLRIDHESVEWKEGRIETDAFIPIVFEVERTSASPKDCGR